MFTGQITRNKGLWQVSVFTKRQTTFSLFKQLLKFLPYLPGNPGRKETLHCCEYEAMLQWSSVYFSTVITEHQLRILENKVLEVSLYLTSLHW